LALVLEVGVALAKNQIETALYNELESRIAHATRLDRLFTNDSEMQRLADMLRKFAGTTYSVTVDSADYNVNSEQEKFSVQLKNILQAAGWKLSIGRSWAPTPNRGILIGYRSDSAYSKAVVSDLVTIFAQFDIQSAGDPFSDLDEHTITFEIGMR